MKLDSKIRRSFAVMAVAAILFTANGSISPAFTEEDVAPALAAHLSNQWISAAGLALTTEKGVIYYHGTAQRTSGGTEPWRGTVHGDILYVSRHTAMVIPDGTLTVGNKEALKVTGPHQSFVATLGKQPAWLGLLRD